MRKGEKNNSYLPELELLCLRVQSLLGVCQLGELLKSVLVCMALKL
jgi:hypothetical protein